MKLKAVFMFFFFFEGLSFCEKIKASGYNLLCVQFSSRLDVLNTGELLKTSG